MIEKCTTVDTDGWLNLRSALWPDCSTAEHLAEMNEFISNPDKFIQFLARSETGVAVGLAEASVRSDYVNGTEFSPVVFLEGLFVVAEFRRRGIARKLVNAVTSWANSIGFREIASDALVDNEASHTVHKSLGFSETQRVVYFKKVLNP